MFESAVPVYVRNLRAFFDSDRSVMTWLTDEWLPEELEHGRLTQNFVEETWPEFDWQSAFNEYLRRIPTATTEHLRNSPALEALARCVTETHATTMYRCIASYSNDNRLRTLLLRISRDEVRHYKRFRQIFEHRNQAERNSFWRKLRTVLGRSELASGRDMVVTFASLPTHWKEPPPFDPMSFNDFMQRVGVVVTRHYPVGPATRMLLRPIGTGTVAIRLMRWILQSYIRSGLFARRLTV